MILQIDRFLFKFREGRKEGRKFVPFKFAKGKGKGKGKSKINPQFSFIVHINVWGFDFSMRWLRFGLSCH